MTCRAASPTEIERILRRVLADVAVPKPSRTSEHYAALTLSIVLLREQVTGDNVLKARWFAAERELNQLLEKRAALEQTLEAGGA